MDKMKEIVMLCFKHGDRCICSVSDTGMLSKKKIQVFPTRLKPMTFESGDLKVICVGSTPIFFIYQCTRCFTVKTR